MTDPKLPDGIARKDSLDGHTLASGGASVGASTPVDINSDPRALRSGNIAATFDIGHLMRDKRLSFSAGTMTIAPSPRDHLGGAVPITEDGGHHDVVIVGGGMAALASAFYLSRRRPGVRILILDANPVPGGNGGRDDGAPLPTISPTGGAYCVDPYA